MSRKRRKNTALTFERAVAYHEAGHAVVALSLGQRVKRVSIMADEDAGILGRCEDWGRRALLANLQGDVSDLQEERVLGKRPDRLPRERSQAWLQHQVETEIQVMLAGELAAKMSGWRNDAGERGDLSHVAHFAGALMDRFAVKASTRQTSAFIRWLSIRASDLLRARWQQVEAVAAALLERKTLAGRELRQVSSDGFEAHLRADTRRLRRRARSKKTK